MLEKDKKRRIPERRIILDQETLEIVNLLIKLLYKQHFLQAKTRIEEDMVFAAPEIHIGLEDQVKAFFMDSGNSEFSRSTEAINGGIRVVLNHLQLQLLKNTGLQELEAFYEGLLEHGDVGGTAQSFVAFMESHLDQAGEVFRLIYIHETEDWGSLFDSKTLQDYQKYLEENSLEHQELKVKIIMWLIMLFGLDKEWSLISLKEDHGIPLSAFENDEILLANPELVISDDGEIARHTPEAWEELDMLVQEDAHIGRQALVRIIEEFKSLQETVSAFDPKERVKGNHQEIEPVKIFLEFQKLQNSFRGWLKEKKPEGVVQWIGRTKKVSRHHYEHKKYTFSIHYFLTESQGIIKASDLGELGAFLQLPFLDILKGHTTLPNFYRLLLNQLDNVEVSLNSFHFEDHEVQNQWTEWYLTTFRPNLLALKDRLGAMCEPGVEEESEEIRGEDVEQQVSFRRSGTGGGTQ